MIKETFKRIKQNPPKYFKRWFIIYIFTAILGLGTELKSINEELPEFIQPFPKYLITIGTIGLFMSRLPQPDKSEEKTIEKTS